MTVASTGTSGSPLVVNGLISGITTPKVIQALLQGYQVPINNLVRQQSTLQSNASEYRTLSSDFQSILTAAQTLSRASQWDLATATSSDSSVATAVASAGAQTGSLAFTVNQLAQANVLASSQGVSSTGQVVTTAKSLLLSTGATALGFRSLSAGSGLAIGSQTMSVTQSSAAAEVTGSGALPGSMTITTGTNDALTLTVDGKAYTLTLAGGTYTPSELVTQIDAAAKTAGAPVQASLAPTGALRLSSDRQGSTATISVTGGTALTTLHLTVGQAGTGADAVVTVGGTTTTLSKITPGKPVTVNAPGTVILTATVATAPNAAGALVATGKAELANVPPGNGSLATVVSAINRSGLAATASAVQLASGASILQVSANRTGDAGAVTVDPGAFTGSSLGTLQTIAQAQDASVSVGGANGYTLSSSSDTFSNLLSGTAVTVAATGSATVTVMPDATGEASRVGKLVTAANRALADIQRYAGYTTAAKQGGPLMGSAVLANLRDQILGIFGSVGGTSSLADLANAGVTLTKTGTLDFTKQKFVSAYTTDPSQVSALFTQGGTYTPASGVNGGVVGFVYAAAGTAAGTYAVDVSRSASQAVDTGPTVSGGAVSTPETLTVKMGGTTAVYTTSATESLAAVAAGLDQAFAGAKLALTAQVVPGSTQLEIVSNGYGSATSVSVTSTASGTGTTGLGGAGSAATFTGTDVAGTIAGVTATGSGQVLTAPSGAPLDGLSVQVTATGITTTTALGTLTYRPGVAQQLVSLMTGATNPTTGSVTSAIKSLSTEATGLNSQIANYTQLERSQQSVLQNEFVTMETNLGKLKNESSMLTNQLSQLPGF